MPCSLRVAHFTEEPVDPWMLWEEESSPFHAMGYGGAHGLRWPATGQRLLT